MPKCSSKSILFDMDPVTQSCHRRNHDDGKADPVTCVQPDGNNHKQRWSTEKDPLTDRERLILRRAGDGETTAELAHSLRLTEGTVRNYSPRPSPSCTLPTGLKRPGLLAIKDGFDTHPGDRAEFRSRMTRSGESASGHHTQLHPFTIPKSTPDYAHSGEPKPQLASPRPENQQHQNSHQTILASPLWRDKLT
jgi:Bacterial regulatory proteins, luxR family